MQHDGASLDLPALLHTLWRHQAPAATPGHLLADRAPLPDALRTRDAVHEIIRWGLAQTDDPEQAKEAIHLAAWHLDDPAILAATRPWLESEADGPRLAACITLCEADDAAWERLEVDAGSDDPAEVMALVQPACLERVDPSAIAALMRVAGESHDDRETGAAVDHLAHWASDEQLGELSGLDACEALAERLPLRDHPGALRACWQELELSECYRTQRLMNGLAERADPACIEGLLTRWDAVCSESVLAADYRYNEEWDGACYVLDGLALTPDGDAELRRLSSHRDPAVAILAQTFLLRAAPSPEAFDALAALRARHEDPDDLAFGPFQELIDAGGVEAWPGSSPLTPAPRIPVAPMPAFLGLPARASGVPPLVVPPPPPTTGWNWVEAPVWPDDAGASWRDLPVLAHLGPLEVRWAAPLVDANQATLIGDMTQQTTWDADLGVAEWPSDEFLTADGAVAPAWSRALLRAARTLAGRHQGDPEEWLAWLCFTLWRPARALRARAASVRAQGAAD